MYQSYLSLGYVSLWAGFVAYLIHFNLPEEKLKKVKKYHFVLLTALIWGLSSGIAYTVDYFFHTHIEII